MVDIYFGVGGAIQPARGKEKKDGRALQLRKQAVRSFYMPRACFESGPVCQLFGGSGMGPKHA